ncbi:MAG: thrombospondin type 3 repeat-containing protein, partial [Nitrospirae bacterium]|nr:thrombospondin type 3 repeat-containing protein [Nitrospirota bacterium]
PGGAVVNANGCSATQLDDDGDGVNNALDLCPNTPVGAVVNAVGCAQTQLDDDADGVSNAVDLCPNTPAGAVVNAVGCAATQLDDDSDGVNNALDLCPATPAGAVVNANGCAQTQLDDDADGVNNAVDQCPNTPAGAAVNANGCAATQLDDDNDGVNNALDQCPATPVGAVVNANGCSATQLDDDGDGVNNALDLCPNTPAGAAVNANGCAQTQLDDDADGVNNALDLCPNTPAGAAVNANGCAATQLDDDGDGVNNAVDQCPATPVGEAVDVNGCAASQLVCGDDKLGTADSYDVTAAICVYTPIPGYCDDGKAGTTDSYDLAADSCANLPTPGYCDDGDPNTLDAYDLAADTCSHTPPDDDGDGVSNALDQCPDTPNGAAVNANGCSATQLDGVAPILSGVPADMHVAAAGPQGAVVSFTLPTATDDVYGQVAVDCQPGSGTVFGIGDTPVACSASDGAGNVAGATFMVSVYDGAPSLSQVPAPVVVEASTVHGAVVTYASPVAVDAVDGAVPVVCVPASDTLFAPGVTPVQCSAVDGVGNSVSAGFDVTVVPWDLAHRPARPVIYDIEADSDAPLTRFEMDVSTFSDADGGTAPTIVAWRIANPGGEVYVGEEAADALALPEHVLLPGADYDFAVRHMDDTGLWSEWSAPFTVSTIAVDPADTNGDGIADRNAPGAPTDTDGNGIADQAEGLLALLDAESGLPVGIASDQGTVTHASAARLADVAPAYADMDMPHGLLRFRVVGLDPGGTATVVFHFPDFLRADARWFWFDGAGTRHDLTGQAALSGFTVSVPITDGAVGDGDGVANGVIVDPSGPGVPVNAAPPAPALVYPADDDVDVPTRFTFVWKKSADPDGDAVTYAITYCRNPEFAGCTYRTAPAGLFKGLGMVLGAMGTAWAVRHRRHGAALLLAAAIGAASGCGGATEDAGGGHLYAFPPYPAQNEVGQSVFGLRPDTTYYWKVMATDAGGNGSESPVMSFRTAP